MPEYRIQCEVAGPLAMYARPDTGGSPTNYPAPPWSAAKGLLEAIAFLRHGEAWLHPTRVEVCRPVGTRGGVVSYQRYAFNYGGPLRKDLNVKSGTGMQVFSTVLGTAAANPLKALGLLCRRWPPYAAWAANSANISTEAAKSDKNKSRALKDAFFGAQRVRPIAAEIHDDLKALRDRPDDAFRAELLLGYMAGLPVPKKADIPATKTSDDSADQDMEEQG